jgi:hypothetical protein
MKIKQQSRILVVRQRQRNKLRQLSLLSRLADEVGCSKHDNITKNKNQTFQKFTD